jgi:predicted DNA-binding transcriptional regulator AlpA
MPPSNSYLTAKEAAKLLHVGKSILYSLFNEGNYLTLNQGTIFSVQQVCN